MMLSMNVLSNKQVYSFCSSISLFNRSVSRSFSSQCKRKKSFRVLPSFFSAAHPILTSPWIARNFQCGCHDRHYQGSLKWTHNRRYSRLYNNDIFNTQDETPSNTSEYIHPTTQQVCVLLPTTDTNDVQYEEIAREIATNMTLPLIHYNARTRDYSQIFTNEKKEYHKDIVNMESFSHCLHILPYPITTTTTEEISTYAISIQPIRILDASSRKQKTKKKKKNPKLNTIKPICIDFCASSRLSSSVQKELAVKAVSPTKAKNNDNNNGAIVYDLTAGFGQDAAILALGGASRVYMIERDPIVALLLQDALRRLNLYISLHSSDSKPNSSSLDNLTHAMKLHQKLRFIQGDGATIMNYIAAKTPIVDKNGYEFPHPDVCYLDPMFPTRTKSAAVKKNMQVLHSLLQTKHNQRDTTEKDKEILLSSEQSLLQSALEIAKLRVVVKRPIHAPTLGTTEDMPSSFLREPSFNIRGSINRWDVYMNNNA